MKYFSVIVACCMIFAASCGSADTKDENQTLLEKKIEMIKTDNKEKPVEIMVKAFELKKEKGVTIPETPSPLTKRSIYFKCI